MPREKQPALLFYHRDYLADPAVNSVSFAAQGLWVKMLCLMAASDRFGYLTVSGKPIDVPTLARLCGGDVTEVSRLIDELESAEVFSKDRRNIIYSRRMVRDAERALNKSLRNARHYTKSKKINNYSDAHSDTESDGIKTLIQTPIQTDIHIISNHIKDNPPHPPPAGGAEKSKQATREFRDGRWRRPKPQPPPIPTVGPCSRCGTEGDPQENPVRRVGENEFNMPRTLSGVIACYNCIHAEKAKTDCSPIAGEQEGDACLGSSRTQIVDHRASNGPSAHIDGRGN